MLRSVRDLPPLKLSDVEILPDICLTASGLGPLFSDSAGFAPFNYHIHLEGSREQPGGCTFGYGPFLTPHDHGDAVFRVRTITQF